MATDISCHQESPQKTFWAIEIYNASHNRIYQYGGDFSSYYSSGKAEMHCIAKAFHIAGRQFNLKDFHLKLYSDLSGLLEHPKNDDGTPKKSAKYRFLEEHILPYLTQAGSYQLITVRGKVAHPELGNRLQARCHGRCRMMFREYRRGLGLVS